MERLFKMRGILDLVNSPDTNVVIPDDDEMAGYLMSKLDPSTHTKIITPENEDSTKLIWLAAKNHFASSQAANWARLFFNFLYLGFNQNDIDGFVTSIKTHLGKLDEIGIILPDDILSYLILFKLPDLLKIMRSQIMHSGNDLTVKLVLNHLVQHKNKIKSETVKNSDTNAAMFHSSENSREYNSPRCENGKHNPAVKSHPASSLWAEFPELRPNQSSNKSKRVSKKKQQAESHFYDYSFFCASNHLGILPANRYILDSGCSIHMFQDQNSFLSLTNKRGDEFINTGKKGEGIAIKGVGTALLLSGRKKIQLKNAAWVPDATVNLIYLGALLLKGFSLRVNSTVNPPSFVLRRSKAPVMTGAIENNLLIISIEQPTTSLTVVKPLTDNQVTCDLSSTKLLDLHLKLGHASVERMEKHLGYGISSEIAKSFECVGCKKSKISKSQFNRSQSPAARVFNRLHLDLMGPLNPISKGGMRFALTVVNNKSGYLSAFPLPSKAAAVENIKFLI